MPDSSDAATDKNRVLQFKSPFGADVVATHVSGSERLSQLFQFDLSLQSEKGDLSADKILGSPVTILFHAPASEQTAGLPWPCHRVRAGRIWAADARIPGRRCVRGSGS